MSIDAPLSARVSQVLVAYTIEVDNVFDLHMSKAGFDEYGLSLVAWSNLMQYVGKQGVPCQAIMDRTHATQSQVAQIAGTLERWFVIEVQSGERRGDQRPGWLTSKGITATSVLRPTPQGKVALKAWPTAVAEVESRWASRYSRELGPLRKALAGVITQAKTHMPEGVPSGWLRGDWRQFPSASAKQDDSAPLHVLLSRALLALTMAFERESAHPLALVANTLRVLDEAGMPLSAIGGLSGLPSQMSSVQVTAAGNAGLATITADPTSKIGRKLVRLTKTGAAGQGDYVSRCANIEAGLGRPALALHTSLSSLLDGRIAQALTPPPGVRRSGTPRPPLGMSSEAGRGRGETELYMGAGQETRNKELVAQTEAFLGDPQSRLPHYPVWDQNRGFGP